MSLAASLMKQSGHAETEYKPITDLKNTPSKASILPGLHATPDLQSGPRYMHLFHQTLTAAQFTKFANIFATSREDIYYPQRHLVVTSSPEFLVLSQFDGIAEKLSDYVNVVTNIKAVALLGRQVPEIRRFSLGRGGSYFHIAMVEKTTTRTGAREPSSALILGTQLEYVGYWRYSGLGWDLLLQDESGNFQRTLIAFTAHVEHWTRKDLLTIQMQYIGPGLAQDPCSMFL